MSTQENCVSKNETINEAVQNQPMVRQTRETSKKNSQWRKEKLSYSIMTLASLSIHTLGI